eukprot:4940529-Pyramimonas_sp.AAC.1
MCTGWAQGCRGPLGGLLWGPAPRDRRLHKLRADRSQACAQVVSRCIVGLGDSFPRDRRPAK